MESELGVEAVESDPAEGVTEDGSTQHTEGRKASRQRSRAGEPRVVVVMVGRRPLFDGMCISLAGADELTIARGRTRSAIAHQRKITLKLDDRALSHPQAIIRRVTGGWELIDQGSKNRTRVDGNLVQRAALFDGSVIEVGRCVLIFRSEGFAAAGILRALIRDDAPHSFVFRTHAGEFERHLFDLTKFATTSATVLVCGDPGTGKELIARALHDMSGRPGEFVAINCGALSPGLIESELFGYRRGAFSGATENRPGLVRSADRGTLFLDEIGEMKIDSQVALLRVLQEREVMPVGGGRPVPVDIRVIAATNLDLDKMIARGRFRRDLHTRLTGFELDLPSVRERPEDVGLLMAGILQKQGGDALKLTFDGAAAVALLVYDYPGNVRELEHALIHAKGLAEEGIVKLEHLPPRIQLYKKRRGRRDRSPKDDALVEQLLQHLRATNGNVSNVGRLMGKAHTQILRWCKRFGIDPSGFREPGPRGKGR